MHTGEVASCACSMIIVTQGNFRMIECLGLAIDIRRERDETHYVNSIGVIPYQFSKSSHMTPSELPEIWYVGF